MDPTDLNTFNHFIPTADLSLNSNSNDQQPDNQNINLADLILEKITAHEAVQGQAADAQSPAPQEDDVELPAKVVEAYTRQVIDGDGTSKSCSWRS